jgi:ABC-type transporter Mla subunit MlaD
MSYHEELMRLQKIITADGSTDAQRKAARTAKARLIDGSIEEAFDRFQNRTEEFNGLVSQLKSVVDKIAANQLTGVIDTLDNVVSDVQQAAEGPKPDEETNQ